MRIIAILFFICTMAFGASAEETFIGTIRTTMGNPVKGVKVYVDNPKKTVKSDKKGEFKFTDVKPTDSISINYKKHIYSFAVNGRQDMMLVVGEDNRIFDRENYTGETFQGNLVDYKGRAIRGAIVYKDDPFDYVKSDKDGIFLIDNIEPTDTIHVKYNGDIHDIAMDGSKGMYIKILRKPITEKDGRLNIGAGSILLKDYCGPYTMIDAKYIETTGARTVSEAVKWMPGVTVDRSGISVRRSGVSPLWVIDGIVNADPESIDVRDVESIILLKDGAMWGTRGMGGVFIVITKGNKW